MALAGEYPDHELVIGLVGTGAPRDQRARTLCMNYGCDQDQANDLIRRDEGDQAPHGQHTRDAFQLADLFIDTQIAAGDRRKEVDRFLDLVFGHPYTTPRFDEYAMFLAFAAALRSADLSRQVGAVIASGRDILATGANDVPRAGGGAYGPEDATDDHRDYREGFDANKKIRNEIVEGILSKLSDDQRSSVRDAIRRSSLMDMTEYSRAVHAEMEALLSCSRRGVSTAGATLYCTTCPCHNCMKHLIDRDPALGVRGALPQEPCIGAPS